MVEKHNYPKKSENLWTVNLESTEHGEKLGQNRVNCKISGLISARKMD